MPVRIRSTGCLVSIIASIVLTVLSLNLLGDALNDAFNPRLSA